MTVPALTRLGLGWLALNAIQIGGWALLAPRSFYDDYPGLGRSWVAVDGPYNEHLVRDVGALNLAIAAVLIWAAVRLTSDLVAVAAVASLVWNVPHLIYHLFNTENLAASDIAVSLVGLAVSVLVAAALLGSRPNLARDPARPGG